ncbi:FemAB family PEP-CTERM system-associated protein [bacterium]|nr:FemAB family PEP-CTERM system-associated protein [bacterium]
MSVDVTILTKSDEPAWSEYAGRHDRSTFFHQLSWRDLTLRFYPCEPVYLLAKVGGRVTGILPLMVARNGFFGSKLASLPYAVLGGVCADTDESAAALVARAGSITRERRLDFLELKQNYRLDGDLVVNEDYVTFILPLENDPDIHWRSFHNEMRRCVRRGRESGYTVTYSTDIDSFYRIFARAHRELGTPVNSRAWIEGLVTAFPEQHRILTAVDGGRVIAAMLVREYRDSMDAVFGYVLKEHRNRYPLYVMYWRLIEEACLKGLKTFNFGRSIRESGTYTFKRRWGAEPRKLYYHYLPNTKMARDVSQKSPRRGRISRVWRHLPLPLANTLGPWLRIYFT